MAEYILRNNNSNNNNNGGRYRSKVQLIGQILEVVSKSGRQGIAKTRIMYRAVLGYEQLEQLLVLLIENDLLYYDKEMLKFKITEKGILFLQAYNQLNEMLKKQHC
jgi:predicted transcriptional regulator